MNVHYIELQLLVSDSDGTDDGGQTLRLESYMSIPDTPADEAATKLPDLVAPLVASLVTTMQRELKEASE